MFVKIFGLKNYQMYKFNMNCKQTGYDFWNSVLGKPTYVAAPMVDMSELAFRMLCRSHGSQLCYSPMLHSQQFVQDYLYRQDNFSTCNEDRPLIVQFCANNPETFADAALLVSSQCDAVDLNLGCPQAIAKKGYYGAFLQDNWDLIHSIVRKAANELPIPVTCKMRILPGDIRRSVDYARMLEDSGCSVITVHGRTRDQKGHATGLASWNAIQEIKAHVKIPVIANGNILTFNDVQDCLKQTGADAVMSAEALLQNPSLFSGENPYVWDIVEDYLKIAEKCNTPIRCVRCHLFKILYLCIYQNANLQELLAEGSTYSDFYSIVKILKEFPQQYGSLNQGLPNHNESKLIDQNKSNSSFFDTFDEYFSDCDEKVTPGSKLCPIAEYSAKRNSPLFNLPAEDSFNVESDLNLRKEVRQDDSLLVNNMDLLPVWVCHSRPRLIDNEKNRGCYSKYFSTSTEKPAEDKYMSKKKMRKLRRHERVVAGMKEKRKMKKQRKKEKLADQRLHSIPTPEESEREKLTKKQQKLIIKDRLLMAQGSSPKICINLGFSSAMEIKELTRLSSQLRRLYGSNRHSRTPVHLFFCNFSLEDELYKICLAKNDGFSTYIVDMSEKAPEELFELADIIYLSPDSDNVLESLDNSKVYIIGGIVDDTVRKNLSLNHAKDHNVKTARLPITEHLVRFSSSVGTTVLTVNQVFDILLTFYETKDWTVALSKNVPLRKGYCAPSEKDELQHRKQNSTSAPANCEHQILKLS